MKLLFISIFALLFAYMQTNAQNNLTDKDLADKFIGKTYAEIMPILDSNTAYYKMHYPQDIRRTWKVASVSLNGNEVKLYTFKFDKNGSKITSVVINFRHDNMQHLRDLENIEEVDSHVGKYSTDIIIKD